MVLSVAVLEEYHRQKLNSKPLIVAVEEPEVHMHSEAQRAFLEYLRWLSQKHQVLLSSHAPVFVDRTEPENVLVLKRASQRDQKQALKAGKQVMVGTVWKSAQGRTA